MQVVMKTMYSLILLSLGNKVLGKVSQEKNIDKHWTKLESWYMRKPLHNLCFLKKQLYTLLMYEGESILKNLENFNQIILSLNNIVLLLMARIN